LPLQIFFTRPPLPFSEKPYFSYYDTVSPWERRKVRGDKTGEFAPTPAKVYGCCLDAETAYYLERGLKTLHLRMEKHNQNMFEVYRYLARVSETFGINIFHPFSGEYPIPNFARALVDQKRLGGMITFNINGKEEKDGTRLMKILHKTGVIKHATSLGGVESLISMPYNMSQSSWSQQELLGLKKCGCLLRLSVGIEEANDIIDALDHGLREICK
jgi:cystathionine beta-lyase/cystathionine gamma-synthase